MRLVVITLVVLAACAGTVQAQIHNFPYEATVVGDDVNVRSGPGRKYYETGRLRRGETVTVHRHDPGGWYMIAPPPSSFSWIRADEVKPVGNNCGVVIKNEATVWVGSDLCGKHDLTQRQLSSNDKVEILGEKSLEHEGASVRLLKIVPPRFEFRWMDGKYLTPIDAHVRGDLDRDPFAVPSPARPFPPGKHGVRQTAYHTDDDCDFDKEGERTVRRKFIRSGNSRSVRNNGPTDEILEAEADQLAQLDDRFHDMVKRDPSQWRLRHLERDYLELRGGISRLTLQKQIDSRLESIQRYAKIKREYDEFIELTSATTRRDQELVARQCRPGCLAVAPRWPAQRTARRNDEDHRDDDRYEDMATLPPIPVPRRDGRVASRFDVPIYGGPIPDPVSRGPYSAGPIPNPHHPQYRPYAGYPQYSQPGFPPWQGSPPYPQMSFTPPPYAVPPTPIPLQPFPEPQMQASAPVYQPGPAMAWQGGPTFAPAPAFPATPTPAPMPVPGPSQGAMIPPGGQEVIVSGPVQVQQAPTGSSPALPAGEMPPVPQASIQQQTIPALPEAPVQQSGSPQSTSRQPAPTIDGAGIVQRAAVTFPGAPKHVLLAPNGRILAFLQGEVGLDLDRYVGQQMGVTGTRFHRPDLSSDFIIVRSLSPVRLEPESP